MRFLTNFFNHNHNYQRRNNHNHSRSNRIERDSSDDLHRRKQHKRRNRRLDRHSFLLERQQPINNNREKTSLFRLAFGLHDILEKINRTESDSENHEYVS